MAPLGAVHAGAAVTARNTHGGKRRGAGRKRARESPTVAVSTRLDREDVQRLEEAAACDGVSRSEIVRRSVVHYLQRTDESP